MHDQEVGEAVRPVPARVDPAQPKGRPDLPGLQIGPVGFESSQEGQAKCGREAQMSADQFVTVMAAEIEFDRQCVRVDDEHECLILCPHGLESTSSHYYIPLREVSTRVGFLTWLDHLSYKKWFRGPLLRMFAIKVSELNKWEKPYAEAGSKPHFSEDPLVNIAKAINRQGSKIEGLTAAIYKLIEGDGNGQ